MTSVLGFNWAMALPITGPLGGNIGVGLGVAGSISGVGYWRSWGRQYPAGIPRIASRKRSDVPA